jgi:hypothetical protein
MDDHHNLVEPVGFFSLSRELRDRIYEFYYELDFQKHEIGLNEYTPNASDEIDLLEAEACMPFGSLSKACRQFRHETLEHERAARLRFWRAHDFFISLEANGHRRFMQNQCGHIFFGIKALPSRPRLKRLCFRTVWLRNEIEAYNESDEPPSFILVTASPEHGVEWKHYRRTVPTFNDVHTNEIVRQLRDKEYGVDFAAMNGNGDELDVFWCVEMVCKKIFEHLNG